MKKLPKEKRNQVILVWLVVVAIVVGWAFMVLDYQLTARQRAQDSLSKRINQFSTMTNLIKLKDDYRSKAEAASFELDVIESKMTSGDAFSWSVNTLRDFKQGRNVDLPQISQPTITKTSLLPGFPYDQARLTVAGLAHFHDLGLFIADFENQYPNARINNLDIEPGTSGDERLNFRIDIIFLVKPEQPANRS
jgi:hypothetical protein